MSPPSERTLLSDRHFGSTLGLGTPQSAGCAYPFRPGAPSQPACGRTVLWAAAVGVAGPWGPALDVREKEAARGLGGNSTGSRKSTLKLSGGSERTRCPPCQATWSPGTPRPGGRGQAGSFRPALGPVGSQTRPSPDRPHCGFPGGVAGAGGPGMLLGSRWGRGSRRRVPHQLSGSVPGALRGSATPSSPGTDVRTEVTETVPEATCQSARGVLAPDPRAPDAWPGASSTLPACFNQSHSWGASPPIWGRTEPSPHTPLLALGWVTGGEGGAIWGDFLFPLPLLRGSPILLPFYPLFSGSVTRPLFP